MSKKPAKKTNPKQKNVREEDQNSIHNTRRKIEDILIKREQDKLFEL